MPPELLTRTDPGALLVRSEEDRVVEARVVPWDVVGRTAQGPERFARGAFAATDPSSITLEAIGPHGLEPGVRLAGRSISLEDREDGAYAAFRVSRTAAGDELLELVRDGVYRDVSAVFEPIEARSVDGVIERRAAILHRVGIVERGAYPGAAVLAVRSSSGGSTPMPPDATAQAEPIEAPQGVLIARSDDNAEQLASLRDDMLNRMTALEARGAVRQASPLARFASLADYLLAAAEDPDVAVLLARALADQTTVDNPGVMQPSFVGEVAGIIAASRPAVAGFGAARSLGSTGMALNWPYYAGDLTTLVGKQAAEKTEITSVKVSILNGTTPIETFAGGSDVSYQLIRRSSPSYLEAYGRIMAAGWALTTESTFEAALLAGAGGSIVYDPTAADPNGSAALAAFFEASAKVKRATGSPASIALAAPDVFLALGSNPALKPPAYGTSNVPGTAQASTLRVNVSGLEVIEAPFLTAGSLLFSNPAAAGWHEDGPFVATAEDVAKLGQNRAIWSMGATAIYLPAGVVKTALVARKAAA